MDKAEGERCYNEVEQEDEDPTEHSRGYSAEKHGLPEADHRASRWSGRSHLVVRMPLVVTVSTLKTTFGGFHLGTEGSAAGGVRLAAASTIGKLRTGFGRTRQHAPPRRKSVSSARGAARNV